MYAVTAESVCSKCEGVVMYHSGSSWGYWFHADPKNDVDHQANTYVDMTKTTHVEGARS